MEASNKRSSVCIFEDPQAIQSLKAVQCNNYVNVKTVWCSLFFQPQWGPSYDGVVVHSFGNQIRSYLDKMSKYRWVKEEAIMHSDAIKSQCQVQSYFRSFFPFLSLSYASVQFPFQTNISKYARGPFRKRKQEKQPWIVGDFIFSFFLSFFSFDSLKTSESTSVIVNIQKF